MLRRETETKRNRKIIDKNQKNNVYTTKQKDTD
jgi:hypothetical protein